VKKAFCARSYLLPAAQEEQSYHHIINQVFIMRSTRGWRGGPSAMMRGRRGRPLITVLLFSLFVLCSSFLFATAQDAETSSSGSVCIASSPQINADFMALNGDVPIPTPGSCCMQDVCGLACPLVLPEPAKGTLL
jgi:hypothetical protein